MVVKGLKNNRGFLLVMAMWTLAFLAVLAVTLALGVRQKITLLSRLEDRAQAQLAAEAGIKKAVALLIDDLENNQFVYSAKAKARRHNNPDAFFAINVGGERAEVVCPSFDEAQGRVVDHYGLCDEQARINLNTADRDTLARLIADVTGSPDDVAAKLAEGIMDWRDYGRRQAEGFFSDEYYSSLEYPYKMKEQNFERIDELLLVKGITAEIFNALRPFITVSGDGRVNMNTASRKVLAALGLEPAVVDKFLKARRGADGQDGTGDDHIFFRTFDIAAEVNALVKLEEKDMRQFDVLNARGLFATDSMIYGMLARVPSGGEGVKRSIEAVFNALSNKFEYWYEK